MEDMTDKEVDQVFTDLQYKEEAYRLLQEVHDHLRYDDDAIKHVEEAMREIGADMHSLSETVKDIRRHEQDVIDRFNDSQP